MKTKQELICRLCLNVAANDFKKIDDTTRKMLEVLILRLNLDISKDPIICQNCIEIAKKSVYFKSTYLNTEVNILKFCVRMENVEFDINDVYREISHVDTMVNEHLNICRFCIARIERNNSVCLDILTNETMFQMSEHIQELDLNIIKNPLICARCRDNLECYFKFIHDCLDIEENIKAYCQEKRTDSTGQVKLGGVLRFLFKHLWNYPGNFPQMYPIKQELEGFQDTETVYVDIHSGLIKLEDKLEIKEKEINLNENSRKNLSDSTSDKCVNAVPSKKNDIESNLYKCPSCAFEAKRKWSVNRHMLIHKGASEREKYKCSLCAFETIRKQALTRHMLLHKDVSEINMSKCSVCDYQTKHEISLKRHMMVHKDVSETEMYKCSLCDFSTKYRNYLRTHKLVHKDVPKANNPSLVHKDGSETYKCASCFFETIRKSALTRHMIVHKKVSEVKWYKCTICDHQTKHGRILKSHMLIHKDISEIETYKCSLCAYRTKRRSYLRTHMLVHKDVSEIKMYKCASCHFETKRKRSLQTHMLIHEDR